MKLKATVAVIGLVLAGDAFAEQQSVTIQIEAGAPAECSDFTKSTGGSWTPTKIHHHFVGWLFGHHRRRAGVFFAGDTIRLRCRYRHGAEPEVRQTLMARGEARPLPQLGFGAVGFPTRRSLESLVMTK